MHPTLIKAKEFLNEPANLDNAPMLANLIIKLAAVNIELGVQMAETHLEEIRIATNYMSQIPMEGEKKMTNSEAEKRAIAETFNNYEKLKNQHEDIVELINAIKKRLDVLQWEYKHG